MTVTSGKFSKLPYLPLRVIASHMDLKDLLTITLMSPQINSAIVFLNYSIQKLKWIVAAPGHFVIHIIQKDQPKIILKLASQVFSKFVLSQVLINDQKTKISRNGHIFAFQCGSSDSKNLRLFEALTKFVFNICKPEKFDFCSNLFIKSIFEHTRKFETFKLTHQKLSVENAKLIFEGIEADVFRLDEIQIETTDFETFQLKHREMDLGAAPWLSKESLQSMKCENLKFSHRKLKVHHIQASDITHFAKSWLAGKLENRNLEIYLPRDDINHKKIETELDSELRKLDGVEVDSSTFRLRRADGKRAEMDIHWNSWSFKLL